ncbi:MAG: MoaD/ThiS family protein [Nocardiopsaceae bacterium]|nr:MoaD/ThiS family protein [Nocardiopsaceae bacterium]
MSVTVVIPQVLRADCDGQARVDLPLAAEGRVPLHSVLDELVLRHPRLAQRLRDERGRLRRYVNVFVDADECRSVAGLDTLVADGAEVRVLPSVAGG